MRNQIISNAMLRNIFQSAAFMPLGYTIHPCSVNSPAGAQANPVFTSGTGSRSSRRRNGRERRGHRQGKFLQISNSICFLMPQFRAATARSLENHSQSLFFHLSCMSLSCTRQISSDTVTCSPFHGGRWCISQSFFLRQRCSRCSATGAREELQLQKCRSCCLKCSQHSSELVRLPLLRQILSLRFSCGDSPDGSTAAQRRSSSSNAQVPFITTRNQGTANVI